MTTIPAHVLRLAKDRSLAVTVRVGKQGLTDAVVQELGDQLERRRVVKVKANRGWDDRTIRTEIWEALAAATSSELVLVRGSVAVYWRSRP